jgi:hypothetical protein
MAGISTLTGRFEVPTTWVVKASRVMFNIPLAPRFSEVTLVSQNGRSRFNGFRKNTVETVAMSMVSREPPR